MSSFLVISFCIYCSNVERNSSFTVTFPTELFIYLIQQVKQMTEKDERIKIMNEVLSGMKV